MSVYQPRIAPSYSYDSCYASLQGKGATIFGYGSFTNYVTAISLEILPGTAAKFRQFTGKERDSESGLDYFGARYYGSALGGVTSPDWSATPVPVPYADLSNPQSLNQYSYVLNNPLAHPDADGHCGLNIACWNEVEQIVVTEGDAVRAAVGTALVGGAALAGRYGDQAVSWLGAHVDPNLGPSQGEFGNPNVFHMESSASSDKPGTLGKPDHQQTANEEAERIDGRREVKIDTPGGQKGSRRADAAQVDENGKPNGEIVQVYRPTKGGNIPKREVSAANDIEKATGTKPTMVPVRPVKPPCTSGSGGGCQQ